MSRDIEELKKNKSIFVTQGTDVPYTWQATIIGPPGSPYEDGVFKLDITFPSDYPIHRPIFKFCTPIFHPNIDDTLCVKSDILKSSNWRPNMTIAEQLLHIDELLKCPKPMWGVHPYAAYMYRENKSEYFRIARKWTQKYAK